MGTKPAKHIKHIRTLRFTMVGYAPFIGLHARIDHLIGGHERGLTRLHALIAEPNRVVDVFHVLFRRVIDQNLLGLATGESLAHLNCLIARRQATRTRDANGVDWYQAAA